MDGVYYENTQRVIHDEVGELQPLKGEHVIEIYGKKLLFLDALHSKQQVTIDNPTHQSDDTSRLLETMYSGVSALGMHDAKLGIFGSRHLGLDTKTSDIDLAIEAQNEQRSELYWHMNKTLTKLGYVAIANIHELQSNYARRYADRFDMPLAVGQYTANKRMRWMAPDGVSTSLQITNSNYDHGSASKVVGMGFESDVINEPVHIENLTITGTPEPYNFPRLWTAYSEREGDFSILSFDWTHQGMGDCIGENYTLRASSHADTAGGKVIVLSSNTDYIIPRDLA